MTALKRLAALLCLATVTFALHAEDYVLSSPKGEASVRAAAVYDPEFTPDGSSTLGFELSYAAPIFPFENMSFSFGHLSKDDIEQNYFLLNFEDSYPLAENLALYGTSGIGALLLDLKPGEDKETILGRLAIGTRYTATETLALFAEVNFLIAHSDVWLDGTQLENRNWQYLAGVQYKF